nr:uncharacterized protein LOC129273541 isoform X1 [Lytechinus pictus]
MQKAYYLSKTGGVGPLITKSQGRYKDHFKGNIVNSLLKGENVGITRRTNRAPAVTTQATTTTHTRTVQRSHSPSHAPSGPQTTVISNNSSSSSGGNGGSSNSKKKRKENKDVTQVSTPPVVPQEQPEKADKTLG